MSDGEQRFPAARKSRSFDDVRKLLEGKLDDKIRDINLIVGHFSLCNGAIEPRHSILAGGLFPAVICPSLCQESIMAILTLQVSC